MPQPHYLFEIRCLIVFGIVLVEQLGLPIPAFPILVVAGALAVDGDMNGALVLAAALSACLISDFPWFRAGRHFGKRILRLLCRISLSPDYCVSQTEDKFKRWGPKALIVSKFVPGFNTVPHRCRRAGHAAGPVFPVTRAWRLAVERTASSSA